MPDEIDFTPNPVRVTTAGQIQSLNSAIDVSAYQSLVLLLYPVGLEGSGPQFTLTLKTGMQNDTEDGWQELATFTMIDAITDIEIKEFTTLLKYVRWYVKTVGGSNPVLTFVMRGMARMY